MFSLSLEIKVTGTKDELKKTESPLFLLLATC